VNRDNNACHDFRFELDAGMRAAMKSRISRCPFLICDDLGPRSGSGSATAIRASSISTHSRELVMCSSPPITPARISTGRSASIRRARRSRRSRWKNSYCRLACLICATHQRGELTNGKATEAAGGGHIKACAAVVLWTGHPSM
jgi:hypothetical protein